METVFSKAPVASNTNKDLLQKYAFASKFYFSSRTLSSTQGNGVPPNLKTVCNEPTDEHLKCTIFKMYFRMTVHL